MYSKHFCYSILHRASEVSLDERSQRIPFAKARKNCYTKHLSTEKVHEVRDKVGTFATSRSSRRNQISSPHFSFPSTRALFTFGRERSFFTACPRPALVDRFFFSCLFFSKSGLRERNSELRKYFRSFRREREIRRS